MSGEMPMKAVLVSSAKTNANQNSVRLALVTPDGEDLVAVDPQAKPATAAAADIAGVNTYLNGLVQKLVDAGVFE